MVTTHRQSSYSSSICFMCVFCFSAFLGPIVCGQATLDNVTNIIAQFKNQTVSMMIASTNILEQSKIDNSLITAVLQYSYYQDEAMYSTLGLYLDYLAIGGDGLGGVDGINGKLVTLGNDLQIYLGTGNNPNSMGNVFQDVMSGTRAFHTISDGGTIELSSGTMSSFQTMVDSIASSSSGIGNPADSADGTLLAYARDWSNGDQKVHVIVENAGPIDVQLTSGNMSDLLNGLANIAFPLPDTTYLPDDDSNDYQDEKVSAEKEFNESRNDMIISYQGQIEQNILPMTSASQLTDPAPAFFTSSMSAFKNTFMPYLASLPADGCVVSFGTYTYKNVEIPVSWDCSSDSPYTGAYSLFRLFMGSMWGICGMVACFVSFKSIVGIA